MFELWLFTTDINLACSSVLAGIKGIIIDWECKGKEERQKHTGMECNCDTLADLIKIKKSVSTKVICRINSIGSYTEEEVESAIYGGADIIFLPMVKTPDEVKKFLRFIKGRCKAGILIENKEAINNAELIARLSVDYVYIGLNDLSLSRGSQNIFEAVADGTVEKTRKIFNKNIFGFGGITLLGCGDPIPFNLLLKEMSRIECGFGFLRRAFKRDITGRNINLEIKNILNAFEFLKSRTEEEKNKDKNELYKFIGNIIKNENSADV